MQPAVYITLCEDRVVASNSDGSTRTVVLTPKKFWGLGMNLHELFVGFRIKDSGDSNDGAGVTIKWQWSLDAKTWKTGNDVITMKTNPDDYSGIYGTQAHLAPFVRLIAEVKDATVPAATQKTSMISVWGYFKFRVA